MTALAPRESAEFISKIAQDVKVSSEAAKAAASKIIEAVKTGLLNISNFKQNELHPCQADEKAVDWIFLVDTLNFSFWTPDNEEKWTVEWHNKQYTGYFALCAAINKAVEEGINITDASFMSKITKKQVERIFRSATNTSIPLLEERVQILHETGHKLLEKYEGTFVNCLKNSGQSSQMLMKTVVNDFASYRDEAEINGQLVALYKRVQILIGDIWACFEGQGLGKFEDIDSLTMFADYRVPQVLVAFGVMTYSNELLELLKSGKQLENGSREEVEIRGCEIWAVELLVEESRKLLPDGDINSILIDHYLWDYRRDHASELEVIPFHKVRCIYY